ncbi:MAG: site-specific integrase [Planctomycetota bacterium]|jgi:integrase
MPTAEKRKLTKRTIDAIPSPSGAERVVVHDTEVKGFSIRISRGARTFYLYRWIGGRPQRIRLGTYPELTPEAARRLAEKSNGEVAQGKDLAADRRRRRQPTRTDPTLAELFDHTLEHHWKPRARTWEWQKQVFDNHTPASWKTRKLSTLGKVDVIERHTALGKKNGPYIANRWRGILHRLFEVAIEDFDFTGGNPVRKVKPFTEQERERFVTPEELPRLFDAIDAAEDVRVADFLRLALLTGARRGALLRMRFADVDLGRAVWTIPASDSKNGTPVHVPLVPESIEVIRSRLVAAGGREWVFPGRHGKGHLSDVRKPVKKIFDAAGFKDVRLHDLRRTFGSWQAANGSSELLIGKSLGHRNTRSTAVYARLNLDPVRQSVERATNAMREVVDSARAKREAATKKRKGRG